MIRVTEQDRSFELVAVPFDGYGRIGHQARAADALLGAGLREAVAASSAYELTLPDPDPSRGPTTSLINEQALLAQTAQLADYVGTVLSQGSFPLVVGGDCTSLLGSLQAMRRTLGSAALVIFDGHEDTIPLDVSEDGEAANTEIGILLGITGRQLTPPIVDRSPTLSADRLALLGPRDDEWRRQFNVGSVSGLGAFCANATAVAAAPSATAVAAVRFVGGSGWWLHVDVDVLDPGEFAAQGLPDVPDEPGGLTIDQLRTALEAATSSGGCVGMSAAIYDPDQDLDGTGADVLIGLITSALTALKA